MPLLKNPYILTSVLGDRKHPNDSNSKLQPSPSVQSMHDDGHAHKYSTKSNTARLICTQLPQKEKQTSGGCTRSFLVYRLASHAGKVRHFNGASKVPLHYQEKPASQERGEESTDPETEAHEAPPC